MAKQTVSLDFDDRFVRIVEELAEQFGMEAEEYIRGLIAWHVCEKLEGKQGPTTQH